MNTCKDCKYWGRGHIKNPNTGNVCDAISLDEEDSKDTAYIDVYVSDDSGLNARLITRPDFGCTLFSSK